MNWFAPRSNLWSKSTRSKWIIVLISPIFIFQMAFEAKLSEKKFHQIELESTFFCCTWIYSLHYYPSLTGSLLSFNNNQQVIIIDSFRVMLKLSNNIIRFRLKKNQKKSEREREREIILRIFYPFINEVWCFDDNRDNNHQKCSEWFLGFEKFKLVTRGRRSLGLERLKIENTESRCEQISPF